MTMVTSRPETIITSPLHVPPHSFYLVSPCLSRYSSLLLFFTQRCPLFRFLSPTDTKDVLFTKGAPHTVRFPVDDKSRPAMTYQSPFAAPASSSSSSSSSLPSSSLSSSSSSSSSDVVHKRTSSNEYYPTDGLDVPKNVTAYMDGLFKHGYSPLDGKIFGDGDNLFRYDDGTLDFSKTNGKITHVPLQQHDGSAVRFFVTHSHTHSPAMSFSPLDLSSPCRRRLLPLVPTSVLCHPFLFWPHNSFPKKLGC
jgi:hypothetical protein